MKRTIVACPPGRCEHQGVSIVKKTPKGRKGKWGYSYVDPLTKKAIWEPINEVVLPDAGRRCFGAWCKVRDIENRARTALLDGTPGGELRDKAVASFFVSVDQGNTWSAGSGWPTEHRRKRVEEFIDLIIAAVLAKVGP